MKYQSSDPYYSFTPEALIEHFASHYEFEYGGKKIIEIVEKVESSEKIRDYLIQILREGVSPSPKGLELVMNTNNYFMFSKEETLCLGGLICFLKWRNLFFAQNDFDVFGTEEIDLIKFTPICAEFIRLCERNKYNKSDNFFLRFQKKINLLNRKREI